MDKGNYSLCTKDNDNQYGAGFLSILPLFFTIILLGNGLLILAIKSFRIRRVPDLLVGSLAVIDLLNDLGPVLMSIIVFQIDSNGFRDLQMHTLCHVYNWMSACLRLSASFVSTLMALDCFCATLRPLFYRTKVTCVNVAKIIGCGILSAAFIAAWPAIGWGRVNAHRGLCSFDFGSGFALFIAILGYIQLSVVLTSFIAVSLKMRRYQGRLDGLKRGRTLTFQDGKLQAMETSTQGKDNRIKKMEESCKQGNDDVPTTTRKISTLPELSQENHPRSPRKETINSRIKESRQFIKILQSAVFLFYVSWLPIVVCMPFLNFCFLNFQCKIDEKGFILTPLRNPGRHLHFLIKSIEGCLNDFKIFRFVVATVDKHYIGACHPKAPRRSSITFCTDVPG